MATVGEPASAVTREPQAGGTGDPPAGEPAGVAGPSGRRRAANPAPGTGRSRTRRQLREVEAAARQRFGSAAGRAEVEALAQTLQPGERLLALAAGRAEGSPPGRRLVAGTDRRLLLVAVPLLPFTRPSVRAFGWPEVTAVGVEDTTGVVWTRERVWRLREVTPVAEFAALAGARQAAVEPAAPPGGAEAAIVPERVPVEPEARVATLVREAVGGDALRRVGDGAVRRLAAELRAGEEIEQVAHSGEPNGLLVCTAERVGLVPAGGPGRWFDRRDVQASLLPAVDGLLLWGAGTPLCCTDVAPAGRAEALAATLVAPRRLRTLAGPGGPFRQEGPSVAGPEPDRAVLRGDGALLPDVHRTVVDEVPVFWADLPGPLAAHLVFGVGTRDEPYVATGLTRLVARLAGRALDAAAGVSVGPMVTDLHVTGPATAERLRRACRAFTELDTGPLDDERRGLACGATGGCGDDGLAARLWFGNRGLGLAGQPLRAPGTVTAEDVVAWCRRWFHRGNAALALTGPPPAGLRLPLPDGPVPVRDPQPLLDLPTPAWTEVPAGVRLVLAGHWSAALGAGLDVLDGRLTRRLRHVGAVYGSVGPAEGDRVLVTVGADVPAAHAPGAADVLLRTLDELCEQGPTRPETAQAVTTLRAQLDEPDVLRAMPFEDAVAHLTGVDPNRQAYLQAVRGIRREAVRDALRRARSSLIVATPAGAAPAGLQPLPVSPDPPVDGMRYAPALRGGAPRGSVLVAGGEGVSVRLGAADVQWRTVRFADVVGLGVERRGRGDEALWLVSGRGPVVVLRERDWRGARGLADLVRRVVPAHLHVPWTG